MMHGGFGIDPIAGTVIGKRGRAVGSVDTTGYLQVDGRTRGLGILSAHRLIWEAMNGPIPVGLEINHKNGVKTDNRLSNLELVTHAENIRHAYRTGLKSNAGEKHPRHKLTVRQVAEIRRLCSEGVPRLIVAQQFGIHRRSVCDIVNRKTWQVA